MRRSARLYGGCLVALVVNVWLPAVASTLTGEHVCHRVENFTVSSLEQYMEPVEILTLTWCLQIPPRCPETRTELRKRWRVKTEVKYKNVLVCCEGYVMQELVGNGSADAKCVPYCKKCRSGVCTAPNECTCDPGFQGQDCAYECPQGTWGQNCENECNCLHGVSCNPVNGRCQCPAGWMGPRCEEKCPNGQWGANCNAICLCETTQCHHENGECIELENNNENNNNAPIDPFEASGISVNVVPAKTANADYIDVIDFDKEALLPRVTEHDLETAAVPRLLDEMIAVSSSSNPEGLPTKTLIAEKPVTQRPTSPLPARPSSTTEGNQLSQPDSPKKSSFDFDEHRSNFRVIVSPKTDYVKTTHKGGSSAPMSTIPIDIAAMIVVGALVSIGLTSVAALMIFHIRSRLLKAALSIYNQEKVERQYVEKDDVPGKGLDVTIQTLPRTMTRVNPMYNASSDSSSPILTFDERPVEYANGTVTIGIRLSSNLRDLLESHYDKPASCSQRSAAPAENDVEHVYAEIPHSMPFYFGKYT